MGHKINPTSFRMNITEGWKSRWFSKSHFAKQLKEDVKVKESQIKEKNNLREKLTKKQHKLAHKILNQMLKEQNKKDGPVV